MTQGRTISFACLLISAATLSLFLSAAQLQAKAEEDPDLALLPIGAGRQETYEQCISCHSLKIVAQQGMNAEDWESTLAWMIEEQGMEPLEPDTQQLIISYLAKHFGRDRPNYPKK